MSKNVGCLGDKDYNDRCPLSAIPMRFFLTVCLITMLAGCRSAPVAFQSKIEQADIYPAASTHSTAVTDSPEATAAEPTTQSTASQYTIEELVQLGLQENPRLIEASHEIQSLKYQIPQDLSLPDPQVNTVTHLSPVETAAGQQAFALGISQKIVDVDRRATKAAIADDAVRSAEFKLIQLRNELSEKIRSVCYQLLAVRETIRITREDLDSLSKVEEVVLRQYEVKASVTQQDVLGVQVEQSKIENQLAELTQREKSYAARLARLVNIDPTSQIELAESLDDADFSTNVDRLIAEAQSTRPELAAQLAEIQQNRRRVNLARLSNRPDFTIGLNWIGTTSEGISPVANGDDAVLLGIGFNLPVYKARNRAAACQAQEDYLASESRFESLQDEIAEEILDTVAKLESVASTIDLLEEDIIPKSARGFELALEEYSAAKSGFVPMITSWRSLLRYRIMLVNLQSDQMQLLASLARQAGQSDPIDRLSIGQAPARPAIEGVEFSNADR